MAQPRTNILTNADATSYAVPWSAPDMAGFCHGYELRRHRYEHKANEGSLRCRADWETFIGPIERWGSCNPWEGHFGAVVLPFCRPERLALNMDMDNVGLDETQYRTVRSVLGTKQIQSKMLLELLSIDAPCAEVVIDSWKTMISTTAKQDKNRVFRNLDEYIDFRIVDTGAPFVDMLMRFGMGILLSKDEQRMVEPLVKPCYAALGLANDYFSFDIEWEEFQREGDKTTMTNAQYLRNIEEFAAGPGKERPHLLEYLKAEGYQIPGNVAWSLRCPRYHPELCETAAALLREHQTISTAPEDLATADERLGARSGDRSSSRSRSASDSDLSDASPTFWSDYSRSSQQHLLGPAEYISSLPSKGVREAFIDGLNVWLVLPDHRVSELKSIAQTLHNASLMLDDIEDRSPLRRGRPATHTIFGVEQTINSANYLLIDAMQKVRALDDPVCLDIYLDEMHNLFVGQSFDLYWTRQGQCPSEEEYLAMVRQKTSGLFRLLTRLMAQIAPVQRGLERRLSSLSDTLGEFFQIRDDYKNLSSEYTGQKGFCEDLDECKFSFPLIHALNTQPKNVQLRGILQQSRSSGGLDIPLKETVLQHLRDAGSLEYTEKKMQELMERITDGIVDIEKASGVSNWVVRLLIHRLKRILIVLSDANYFPLKKPAGSGEGSSSNSKIVDQPSGFFLMELAKPLQKLLDAGHEVTFASPEGREPQPDPNSESLLAFAGNFYERRRENELLERMKKENGFTKPRKLSSISDDELKSFAGVFIPGGHAPLADLGDNKDLGRILEYFHRENKPTAAICHGPYALLSTKVSGGEFAYKGYKITSWSNAEEKVMESMLGGEVEKVETALMNAGAEMVEGAKEKVGQTTLHRELLTGGNPMAADELGNRFVKMISV
ncbi:isoprenoid synthase domain-containing protein [Aspergillus foveolatus]|uniref:isoprenoid synthase domain-containing protein n=1 Tax=Aspergillus foveolatus TaxID=210207 RepID=UPI003CCC9A0B